MYHLNYLNMIIFFKTKFIDRRSHHSSGPTISGTHIIVEFFFSCQYLHIKAGILSFGGDVFGL